MHLIICRGIFMHSEEALSEHISCLQMPFFYINMTEALENDRAVLANNCLGVA